MLRVDGKSTYGTADERYDLPIKRKGNAIHAQQINHQKLFINYAVSRLYYSSGKRMYSKSLHN